MASVATRSRLRRAVPCSPLPVGRPVRGPRRLALLSSVRAPATAPPWTPVGLLDAEAVEQALVGAPAAPHVDPQVEVDAAAELQLERLTRGRPDRLDHPPLLADEDALLRVGLDPDPGAHVRQVVA